MTESISDAAAATPDPAFCYDKSDPEAPLIRYLTGDNAPAASAQALKAWHQAMDSAMWAAWNNIPLAAHVGGMAPYIGGRCSQSELKAAAIALRVDNPMDKGTIDRALRERGITMPGTDL